MSYILLSKFRVQFITTLLICSSTFLYSQDQKGLDLVGENANDHYGNSVSMADANTIAVGANENGFNDSGHTRVYRWNGSEWSKLGSDLDGEAGEDESGYSVSMGDSNTVAIGAPYNDDNGSNSGHVRVFEWNGSSWNQKGDDIDGDLPGHESGYAVDMPDANTVAIGSWTAFFGGSWTGQVRIFRWNGSQWTQKGSAIYGENSLDRSGASVAMPEANTVAIGAIYNDGGGSNSGHVRVYKWSSGDWVQKGSDLDGEASFDLFGTSVDMPDANTVAVGAPFNDGNGADAGHTRIFEWNGSDWDQKGDDIDGEAGDDQSGVAISMPNADMIAIGANENDGNGSNSGHARIFIWNGSQWTQILNDVDGEFSGDESGYSVSMGDDNTFAVGAINNNGSGPESGHVRVFEICPAIDSTIQVESCGEFFWEEANLTLDSTGLYEQTFSTALGCDSVVTLDLTVTIVDNDVTVDDPMISAVATGVAYQWLDCHDNFAPISGANAQTFEPESNGTYAVEVTENNCVDTSFCYDIIRVGMKPAPFESRIQVFPNPTHNEVTLASGNSMEAYDLTVTNVQGRIVFSKAGISNDLESIQLSDEPGIYILTLSSAAKPDQHIRVLKL